MGRLLDSPRDIPPASQPARQPAFPRHCPLHCEPTSPHCSSIVTSVVPKLELCEYKPNANTTLFSSFPLCCYRIVTLRYASLLDYSIDSIFNHVLINNISIDLTHSSFNTKLRFGLHRFIVSFDFIQLFDQLIHSFTYTFLRHQIYRSAYLCMYLTHHTHFHIIIYITPIDFLFSVLL